MKRLLPVLMLVSTLCSYSVANAQKLTNEGVKKQLVGKWIGTSSSQEEMIFEFTTDGYVSITSQEYKFGGNRYKVIDGSIMSMVYNVDVSKDPIWLDMIMSFEEYPDKSAKIPCIIRFSNKNKMEIMLGKTPTTRYTTIDPLAEGYVLVTRMMP